MSTIEYENLKYKVKTRIYKVDSSFGPGVARIMELVKETGNLSKAYRTMGLSSSKGWKIIKRAEEDLGFALIESITGGSGGGKSRLTEEGELFLEKYSNFTKDLEIQCEKLFYKHFYNH
ncbi:winged helix-turn-helix domain-containing protein [Wansuia hejianensis]|uniref:LysR family transcriptional regulator n=1 Tax=Wansuia hejianensis TaxID=2763667 RepID=A0A926IMA3_9FIRM|nr:LysR family transcriptional regulator [Wansuia hejianensis]MBC8590999.1 LysR family transcriptional regulator [Wansuia hejianensis]